jgi:hypothetical protein
MKDFAGIRPKKDSDKLLHEIANIRHLDVDIIREIMSYNVMTPLQFAVLTGFSRNKIEKMLRPSPIPKLTVVYPFNSFFLGAGPKFIYKDVKFYEIIKYLIWHSRKRSKNS